eukprot:1333155-Amphidinium_carterae.1
MAVSERAERLRAVADVKRNGRHVEDLPARYQADREIVLAAVQQHGTALQSAAEECKRDREI